MSEFFATNVAKLIVTTGATMISMCELLMPLGYNLVFFTGINNKL